MEDDLPLFRQPQARARNSDGFTSHLAAAKVEHQGIAKTQREEVLRCVRENPGRTSGEIAALMAVHRQMPARRLPELREAGLVRNGEFRKCTVLGSLCMTWWIRA